MKVKNCYTSTKRNCAATPTIVGATIVSSSRIAWLIFICFIGCRNKVSPHIGGAQSFTPSSSFMHARTSLHVRKHLDHCHMQQQQLPTTLSDADAADQANILQQSNTSSKPIKRSRTTAASTKVKNGHVASYTLAAVALAFAVAVSPLPADAAMSGGRMGGSSFTPSSRSSYSAPSRSYSAPSRSSYNGGGFSSYSSSGYYSPRPSSYIRSPIMPIIVAPQPVYSSVGAISYGGSRGGGVGILPLVLAGVAFAGYSVLNGASQVSGSMFTGRDDDIASALGPGTDVVKLSIAMDVSDRDDPDSILSTLARISNTARLDTRVGLKNVSSEVALEILRRKSSISAGATSYEHFRNRDSAQQKFNSISVEERSKFEKETISKYDGVDYNTGKKRIGARESKSSNSDDFQGKATQAVITLVLAVDGDSTKIPKKIRTIRDVENTLRTIASNVQVSDCLQGAEILWTPEERTETLSSRDVVADYPDLITI